MDIIVRYAKATNADEAFSLAKAKITPSYISKLKVNADIKYDDECNNISASGKGFDLVLKFDDNNVQVDLNLSFFLKPFRTKIMDSIESELKGTV